MMGWVGMILAVLKNVNRFRNSFADSSFADAIKHTIRETGEPRLLWHQQILFLKTTYSGFDA